LRLISDRIGANSIADGSVNKKTAAHPPFALICRHHTGCKTEACIDETDLSGLNGLTDGSQARSTSQTPQG
jgi:hypothetical protein